LGLGQKEAKMGRREYGGGGGGDGKAKENVDEKTFV